MKLLFRWAWSALTILAIAYFVPRIAVEGFREAIIAALVLGLVNAIVRPFLIVLTIPINILTFGLFTFVINALMFWLVAELVSGFHVDGFVPALLGSVIATLSSWAATQVTHSEKIWY